MAQLQKYKDDFFILLETGFIAANNADEDAATKLFKASQLLSPENSMPKVGFGYVHMLKLELKQACSTFEEVLKKEPNNEMARALLGLSFALTTKDTEKGEALLKQAKAGAKDNTVKNMADTALQFINKFVKKAPTPAAGQPETKKKGKQ
jgi:Flp pilus assembly protein TadD